MNENDYHDMTFHTTLINSLQIKFEWKRKQDKARERGKSCTQEGTDTHSVSETILNWLTSQPFKHRTLSMRISAKNYYKFI